MPGWSAPSPVHWRRRVAAPPGPRGARGSARASPGTPGAETHPPTPSTETDTTMAHWDFPASEPIDAFIDLAAGRVPLTAQPTDVTTVELTASWPGRSEQLPSDVQVSFDGGRLEITGPRRSGLWRGHTGLDVAVTLP